MIDCNTYSLSRLLSKGFALLVLLCSAVSGAFGQDRLELGFMAGGSYYLGEMNPTQMFKDLRPSLGVLGRYMVSDRVAVKTTVGYSQIYGRYNDKNGDVYSYPHAPSTTTYNEGQTSLLRPPACSFKNHLIDVSCLGEINFLSFDHQFKKDETRFTPYVALGLGCTSYLYYDKYGDKKRRFVLSLPFGVGVKYKLNKLLRLGLDWTFHKTFTDELENVEDNSATFDASDPYKNGVHKLTHNNDWFSTVNVTLTFSMWPRTLVCNDGLRSYYRD